MTSSAPDETTYCVRHPEVETALRCGRCETLICPRCLVYTPGGTRCPDCARLRRPPMYELAPADYLRAALAALAVGAVLGVMGSYILPPRLGAGFFMLFIALLAGSGAGVLVAGAMQRATRGKRGLAMQAIAAVAIIGAGLLRHVLHGFEVELLLRDLIGLMLVVIAIVTASGRLR